MKMRFTIYAFGKEIEGTWKEYTVELFTTLCMTYADNAVMFTVEFDMGNNRG